MHAVVEGHFEWNRSDNAGQLDKGNASLMTRTGGIFKRERPDFASKSVGPG